MKETYGASLPGLALHDLFGKLMTTISKGKVLGFLRPTFESADKIINELIEKDGIGKTISFAAQPTASTTA